MSLRLKYLLSLSHFNLYRHRRLGYGLMLSILLGGSLATMMTATIAGVLRSLGGV